MSDDQDDHDDEATTSDERAGKKPAGQAKNELFAALGHLRNAAEILVGAADPAVRKAATEAEKVLHKVGAEAEPMAQKLGAELGKMASSIVGALEGKAPKTEPPRERDESEVERLEREAEDEKKP